MTSEGSPATFGDATGEYLALARRAGLVAARHGVVWVRGPDTVAFLDGLLSQRVAGAEPGHVLPSLLLAPNGKLRAVLNLLVGHEEVGLVADAAVAESVAADLNRFKIRVAVSIDMDERPLLEVWGPAAAEVLTAAGLTVPEGWSATPLIAALPFRGENDIGRYLLAGIDHGSLVSAGAVTVGTQAVEALRIELGEPVVGIDIDDKTIPQEAGVVEGAVDFEKGCYLGQELVARIDSRGRVNRHLRGLVVTDSVLPPEGATVEHDGKTVGTVTSIAESLDLHAPIGLALIRHEVEPGSKVTVHWEGGSAAALVRALPMRGADAA